MKKLLLCFAILLFVACTVSVKKSAKVSNESVLQMPLNGPLEEPMLHENDMYYRHSAYSFVYSEVHEQSKWVAYQLKREELEKHTKRTDRFKQDKLVASKTATNSDYRKSGYDRGHLAPAADMVWDDTAMDESFFFSNISPQLPAFNRGIWKRLEEDVRKWAVKYDSIYVVTGPVFKGVIETIGENHVSIPSHFFKALLVYRSGDASAIGFLFPHEKCKGSEFDYVVSVDSVESFTGLDLFYRLPDGVEAKAESTFDLEKWRQ